jgi:hypothetical protein
MEEINNGKLINLFKVITWFDEKRWNQEIIQDTFYRQVLNDNTLQPEQKILIHWLIYITDRGKRADILWEKNTCLIKKLVVNYFQNTVKNTEDVDELFKEHNDDKSKQIWAYPADLESIRRTLILLLDYDKNIINFMTRKLSDWKSNYPENFIPRIAFSLYLLSYKDVGAKARTKDLKEKSRDILNEIMNKAKSILDNNDDFEKEFKDWYHGDKRWHKRVWAALRDYKKYEQLFNVFMKGIKSEDIQKIWRENFCNQLELPGDIWNIRFFEKCIKPIANDLRLSLRGKNAPRVIRELWEKIKPQESYPEQFDITFDFTSRMCNRNFCVICPFGCGAEMICIPSGDKKYCPVALIACGYIVKCDDNKCIIKDGVGRNICQQ